MISLFKSKPVLDEESIHWIIDVYAWALRNLDSQVFYNESVLVNPTNEYFPGRADSAQGMAGIIFEKVQEYAGIKHWPCRLVNQAVCSTLESPRFIIAGAIRGSKGIAPDLVAEKDKLTITYDLNLAGNPEALIATYAQMIAHYLVAMSHEPPPGGKENWYPVTEVISVFMGFGLMLSNTASTYRGGGCARCNGPERMVALNQFDITYALGIFCVLKNISNEEAIPHLKKTLRSYFKKALKDIHARQNELAHLNLKTVC